MHIAVTDLPSPKYGEAGLHSTVSQAQQRQRDGNLDDAHREQRTVDCGVSHGACS